MLRIPLVLTEADRKLGLANRMLAGRARAVCLAYPPEDRDIPRHVVTGRPIPKAVLRAQRGPARERFGIPATARAVLVTGGSQGARSINQAAVEAFARDVARDFHVIHVTGRRDHSEIKAKLIDLAPLNYTVLAYEPDLGDCLAAADLVVTRSGGSIFEVMAVGLPAVLIPYPHASADHQSANARWMERAGAASVIADSDLTADRLAKETRQIIERPVRLTEMAAASRALAKPKAAAEIAECVLSQVKGGTKS